MLIHQERLASPEWGSVRLWAPLTNHGLSQVGDRPAAEVLGNIGIHVRNGGASDRRLHSPLAYSCSGCATKNSPADDDGHGPFRRLFRRPFEFSGKDSGRDLLQSLNVDLEGE